MENRFERVPNGTVSGTKLCGREVVNPGLTQSESIDAERFLHELEARLGPPERRGDDLFTYTVRDRHTGLVFRAYSAQSGPSYGGRPTDCFEQGPAGYRLRGEVLSVLAEFDRWLEAARD